MKRTSASILSLLIALSFVACKKDQSDTTANQASSGVALQMKAVNASVTMERTASSAARTSPARVFWTAATGFVSQFKIEGKKAGSEVEFRTSINKKVDFFQSDVTLGTVSLPAGQYSEVEFKATLTPSQNEPALELKGRFNNGVDSFNVTFRASETLEVKGEKNNVTVNDSTLHKAVTSMDLARLTKGISATSFEQAVRTSGEILITASVNAGLYKIIAGNLRNLGGDEDFH